MQREINEAREKGGRHVRKEVAFSLQARVLLPVLIRALDFLCSFFLDQSFKSSRSAHKIIAPSLAKKTNEILRASMDKAGLGPGCSNVKDGAIHRKDRYPANKY